MKKKNLILFLLTVIITLGSCNDDDNPSNPQIEDLSLSSQEFLAQYFPDNKIISVSYEPPTFSELRSTGGGTSKETASLYALLEGNIYVAFNSGGNWVNISAKDGIPSSATDILDEYVYQCLIRKEPQAKITSLSPFYDHTIIITLDNGTKRYAQTQLLAYSGTTLAEANITDDKILSKITDFLTRNRITSESIIGNIFKLTETEGTAYRLFMGNVLTISFDENADWIHAEINDLVSNTSGAETLLGTITENEMSASISDAFKNQSNLGGIRIMASYGNGNYGFRFKNKDLLVNENTGIVPPPVEKPNKLVSDYFTGSYKHVYPNGITLVGAYVYDYTFLYEGEDHDITVETDMDGNWTRINTFRIENGAAVYLSLPSKIVEKLPAVTIDYLNKNYENKAIYSLFHDQNGYIINVDRKYMISFNEDGSFKNMVEFAKPQ